MKKIALMLCCVVLAASLCVVAVSCVTYNTKPGTMDKLVGTYELVSYKVTPDAEPGDESTIIERTQDYMEINGVSAYLVVTGQDRGYYFYKDKETDWVGEIVKLSYTYSTDNDNNITDRIENVKWEKGYSDNGDGFPGSTSEKLGFNSKAKNLNATQHSFDGKWIHIENTTSVQYNRVSDDTTTAFAFKAMGKSMSLVAYEIKKLNGMLEYAVNGTYYDSNVEQDINPFIYCLIDFNNVTLDSTVYYATKADYADGKRGAELKKTANYKAEISDNGESISLDFKFADADNNPVFIIHKGNVVYAVMGSDIHYEYDVETNKYVPSDNPDSNSTNDTIGLWYADDSKTFEESLDAFIEIYAASLPQDDLGE